MRTVLSVVIVLLTTTVPVSVQDPCTEGQSSVNANVSFKIQYCHNASEIVEGSDVKIDDGSFTTFTPVKTGTVNNRNVYQIQISTGLTPGQHTVVVKSWYFVRDANGKPTTEKGYSGETSITFDAVQPKFTIGQRVEAWKCPSPEACSKYGDGVAVRAAPTFSSPIGHVHAPGTKGTVLAGPTNADGFTWWQINFDTDPDGWGTETNLVPEITTEPKDCQGTWSDWTVTMDWGACVNGQQTRTLSHTFTVTQEPEPGGDPCPDPRTETKTETRSCTVSSAPAPSATACRWSLQAQPPDSTSGWRAQFRQDGVNVGTRDNSAPYDRVFNVTVGTYVFDVVWSKTNGVSQTSAQTTMVCK